MECIKIFADEIEGRIDPFYYKREFRELDNKLKSPIFREFKEIIEVITKGETPLWRGDNYQKKGVPFLKVQNIFSDGIKGDLTFVSENIHKRMKRSQIKGGEILYTMAGSIGIATIFPLFFGEANINQAIAKILVKKDINKKYLIAVLNSDICFKQAQRNLTTSAQPNINFEQIKSLKIPLPIIEIQNKIVQLIDKAYSQKKQKETEAKELLDSIDDYILEKLGIKLPKIENKMCFVVYSGEIEGRTDSHFYQPEFKDLQKKLKSINHKELGSIVEFSNEIWNQKDFYENEFPYIEISEIDISSGEIQNITYYEKNKAPSRAKMIVRENDIIVSTTRPHRGAISVIDKEKDGFIASTGFAILRKNIIDVNREYLLYVLKTQLSLKQMLQRSSGGSYPAITLEELKKLIIPIPPLEIQQKIAKEVKSRMRKAKQLQEEAKNILEEAKSGVERIIFGEEEIES